jgi:hypothetical protein
MRNKKELETILDNVTDNIRDEKFDPEMVDHAANRVWAKIVAERNVEPMTNETTQQVEHITGCKDFQSLMPAYVRGDVTGPRALLLEDHTRECVPCRKALKEAKTGRIAGAIKPAVSLEAKRSIAPVWKWAVAAVVVIALGLFSWPFIARYFGPTANATIVAANGNIYRVENDTVSPLAIGEEIKEGDRLRVSKDANAVMKLNDGSVIEMRERTEVHLSHEFKGRVINIERGQVIVEAAKQKEGNHLFVRTPDSTTSVVGTIFSVNNGTKGTRVSVVEGEVHVQPNNGGSEKVLKPGDQTTTQVALENVPVKEEVAWSQNAKKYNELLDQLAALKKELNKVQMPEVRYRSTLLDKAPDGTVFYAALPNLTQTLVESHRVMQERIAQNPTLKAWWDKEEQKRGDVTTALMVDRVRQFGERLGDEIVISAEMDQQGRPTSPLVLANAKSGADFRSFLEGQIQILNSVQGAPSIKIVDDPMTLPPTGDKKTNEIIVWINGDTVAVAREAEQLQSFAQRMKSSGPSAFSASPFYARIADVYKEGAGILVAADLEKIVGASLKENAKNSSSEAKQNEANRQLGLYDFKYFIFEQKQKAEKVQTRATLTFSQTDHGIPSWLDAPGPMGALQYVSPDASVASAFVVKEPTRLVDDLMIYLKATNAYLHDEMTKAEKENGVNIRNDIASALGGEFAFALDGPIVPTPSWKIIVEVYDTNRLQQTLERVVKQMNDWASKNGKKGFIWEKIALGGRTFYTIKSADFGLEFNYVFDNGFMIAGASRALIDRALRQHDSNQTLLAAQRFRNALPEDGSVNFSAIVYQNLAPLAKPLAQRAQGIAKQLPAEGQQTLTSLANDAPSLVYAYAQGDRITFAANTEGGPFGIGPATLLGMPTAFQMNNIIEDAMREKK